MATPAERASPEPAPADSGSVANLAASGLLSAHPVRARAHPRYVFVDLKGKSSWDMFSKILEEAQVVTIPGAGFGPGGEGFLRLSAFAPRESCEEACKRLRTAMAP